MIRTVFGDERKAGTVVTRRIADELSLNNVRVLIVEDNAINLKLVSIILKKLECKIDTAKNDKEAVEKIRVNDYEVILMDLQMPVMDGFEAAKIIRNELHQEMPILALTAAVMKEDKEKAMNSGMNDYLIKPVDAKILKTKIHHWINEVSVS